MVLDAGHGGQDTGAIDNGVKEKDINLAVAKRLQADLEKKIKGIKVIMTRNNDTFVTLQGRADIANKNHADLFISIHTNSVDAKNPNRKGVSGTSVYALGLHKDRDNLNVAKRENSVIELEKDHNEKYSGFDPSKDESYIIFEMTQKKSLEQSLRFANYAQKQLVNVAGRKDRGVKQAGFWVLWATSMPAVLVELDFICNPNAAGFMSSSEGEKKLASALCNAVEQYYNTIKSSGVGKRVSLAARNTGSSTSSSNATGKNVGSETASRSAESKSMSSSDAIASLPTVSKSRRTDTPPASSNGKRTTTARKRRSASSKLASDNRDVATSSITVKSENAYLAKNVEKKPDNDQMKKEPVKKESPKERKKRLALEKKKKEKERKEQEALKKKQAKERKGNIAQNNSGKNSNSNVKIIVKNNGEVSKSSKATSNSKKSTLSTTGASSSKRKSLNSKHRN
ncbi:MAG: N-acetylmuramoyl-L-alanine amidase [Muribaculaceae bacterium]|nr:N-acetylmuramoyl-L-alanine amidase [Muribaculaceae bacterium]